MLDIEKADCMVQAIASVKKDPGIVPQLRPHRLAQIEAQKDTPLDPNRELTNLLSLFQVLNIQVGITLEFIEKLSDIDAHLEQGHAVLIGFPSGTSSEPPHIAHLAERYEQPEIIQNGFAQMEWKGYRSDQQYTTDESIIWALMAHTKLPLFIINL